MSDSRDPDTAMPDSLNDTEETGEPVVELGGLSLDVDERFGRRLRGRIERRLLAGEFVNLAWAAPLLVFLEFLRVPFELLAGRSKKD